jgi:hypothetical protein
MVKAGCIRFLITVKFSSGIAGAGSDDGIFPNRLPIDSTGNFKKCTSIVEINIAINDPGIF